MKVGVAMNMLYEHGKPDVAVVQEHLQLGDLVEPLGFDSLWGLEHHFTGYAMSPAPTQLLAYFAGRTKRIQLGTAVIVLPWHDPVRVAEQIALLDIMRRGRIRRLPHPDGRGPRALRRGSADRGEGAEPGDVRARGRVLQDPAHVDPAPADLQSRAALLCELGQS